ncbi:MAG TPA: stage II sporulation protein P [Firmicutes bacterium]|nr:stage II sporulation protein P [Bacillota bacterium]
MRGRVTWCKPASQRYKKKRTQPANVPALLLLVGLIIIVGLKLVAVDFSSNQAHSKRLPGNWPVTILQKALGDAIPGLEYPPVIEKQAVYKSTLDAFYSITGSDLRDPRTILSFELGAGTLVSLPVVSSPYPVLLPGEQEDLNRSYRPASPGLESGTVPGLTDEQGTKPVILIYHTHITESFLPSSQVLFSENMDLSVCRLGKELARLLQDQYGFTVIHHQQVFDQPRRFAYEKARPAIESLLQSHEQIHLVLDIHRDGVSRSSTTAELGGSPLGKILFVIGSLHQEFSSNLKFSLRLQQELEALIPGLSRGIRQQNFVYNQDLHPYSVLVEIGGHENSIEEALSSVPYLAEAVARAYLVFFETRE